MMPSPRQSVGVAHAVGRARGGRSRASLRLALGLAFGLQALLLCPVAQAADEVAADVAKRPRASLLPLAGPIWSTLSDSHKQILAPFEAQWNAWSTEEKRAWVVVADRYPSLSPDSQQALNTRIQEWAGLTPEQRRMARQNYRIARNLPKEARDEEIRRYHALPAAEREALQTSSTSNTAARHAGSRTGLSKHASQPMPGLGVTRSSATN